MISHPPARLYILPAREAPVALIFRRGPSKQVRLILWHTDTDTFEAGQWFNGRIYEWDASLSPDGKLLVYFALDYRRARRRTPEATDSWIAVSRPPYLTAIALWFLDRSGYHVDAAFADNRTLLVRGIDKLAQGYKLPSKLAVRELPTPWDHLRERGWQHVSTTGDSILNVVYHYEKPVPGGSIALELRFRAWTEKNRYQLHNRQSGESIPLDADHAEVDQAGRLIMAQDGKLFAATVTPDLMLTTIELANFNDMAFEAITPPDWAKRWPFERNACPGT